MRTNNGGFSVIEIVLVIVVVGLLAFGAWTFYQAQTDKQAGTSSQVSDPPEITKSDDLSKTKEFLQQTDIERKLDTSTLDAALSQ